MLGADLVGFQTVNYAAPALAITPLLSNIFRVDSIYAYKNEAYCVPGSHCVYIYAICRTIFRQLEIVVTGESLLFLFSILILCLGCIRGSRADLGVDASYAAIAYLL